MGKVVQLGVADGPKMTISFGRGVGPGQSKAITRAVGVTWEQLIGEGGQLSVIEHPITRDEYDAMSDKTPFKLAQEWMMAGDTQGMRGTPGCMLNRWLVTIDLDDGCPHDVVDIVRRRLEKNDIAGFIHSTISHTVGAPRVRVIVPLLEAIDVDDYGLAARILCARLGLSDGVDSKSFVASQVMFRGCRFRGEAGVSEVVVGEPWDALDELCAWGDKEAPRFGKEGPITARTIAPLGGGGKGEARGGVIGAFIRCFTAEAAIRRFCAAEYEDGSGGRMRRVGSKSMGGLVFLGDKVYSHHSTECPIARPGDDGKAHALNSFDAVMRVKGWTMQEMVKWASALPEVQAEIKEEVVGMLPVGGVELVDDGVGGGGGGGGEVGGGAWIASEGARVEDVMGGGGDGAVADWRNDLEVVKGRIVASLGNVYLIAKNLYGVRRNDLTHRNEMRGVPFGDDEVAAVRMHMETKCGVSGTISERNLREGISVAACEARYHPIQEWMKGLVWDGVGRIDAWPVDWLKCDDSEYVRAVCRIWCIAAVARVFEPGCKFDFIPTIHAGQGGGKTLFTERLGVCDDWSGKLSHEFENPQRMVESTVGRWVMEVEEMAGMAKSSREAFKSYISRRVDTIRKAYGRDPGDYPRTCIFIGTTNDPAFLQDETGNRRIWILRSPTDQWNRVHLPTPWEVEQLWAEAYAWYQVLKAWGGGGPLPLYLPDELARVAAAEAEEYRQESMQEGLASQIEEWLDASITVKEFTAAKVIDELGLPKHQGSFAQVGVALKALARAGRIRKLPRTRSGYKYEVLVVP